MNAGTILVVEDTPESLRLLTDILLGEGYNVRPADSGELALASAAASPPDLILLDIRMPGMDGYEVCRRLKENMETRDVPIIFISALNAMEERVEGLRLGAVDFISKPYQRDELLVRVQNHLQHGQMRKHLEKLVVDRTAELRLSKGILEQAVRNASNDKDWGLAVRLMESNALPIIYQNEDIRQWLLGLPREALDEQPMLAYWQAFVLLGSGRLNAADLAAHTAEQAWIMASDRRGQGVAKSIMSKIAAERGEGELGIRLAHESLELTPADDIRQKAIVHHRLGCSYCVAGLPVLAEREFLEACTLSERLDRPNRWLIPNAYAWYGRALFLQGRLNAAVAVCRQAFTLDQQYGGIVYSPNGVFECDIQIERNLLTTAEQSLKESVDLTDSVAKWFMVPSAWASAAYLHYAKGDVQAGESAIDQLREWAIRNGSQYFQNQAEALRAQQWLRDGRIERTALWAAERGLAEEDEIPFAKEGLYFVLARLGLEQSKKSSNKSDQIEVSISLLRRLRMAAEHNGRRGDALKYLVVEVLALNECGLIHEALRSLERALSLSISENSFRVFIQEGEPMDRLLETAGARGLLPETVSSLRAMFDLSEASSQTLAEVSRPGRAAAETIAPNDLLTERESELLQLIHSGLSNAEISEALFISNNTVKTHIKHLYQKLGAGNRAQALARARELRLVA
jgi:DNA-binding NarL/FixJ family response regulator